MELQENLNRLKKSANSLKERSVEERIEALVAWARAWATPQDPYRLEALRRLPTPTGLSPEMIERGIDVAFESVEAHRLRDWWHREGGTASTVQLSAHILSSNVFVAGLPPVIASLLAGVPAFIRPPSEHPEFTEVLVRSWNERQLLGGSFLGWTSWPRAQEDKTQALLSAADRVFVFGGDETIQSIRQLADTQSDAGRVFGFGHRLSLGAIGKESLPSVARWDSTFENLSRDALSWDGQGCLTPTWIFVEGDAGVAEDLARTASSFLSRIAEELPAGRELDPAEGAARAAYLGQAGFEGFSSQGRGWAVASFSGARLEPSPPARSLIFLPVEDLSALPILLNPLGDHLQGLLYVGDTARRDILAGSLAPQGLSRAVPAGMLQRPPIDWNHDGVRILYSLL
jgi:hypothetical protein